MVRVKRLLSLVLVLVLTLGISSSVEAKSKSVTIKAKNVTYAESTYKVDDENSVVCYELSKIKSNSNSDIFNLSNARLVKGYDALCFDKKIIKTIDKTKNTKKKLKFTYTTVDSNSKYYNKLLTIESGKIMLEDTFELFDDIFSATDEMRELIEVYSDEESSESEKEQALVGLMNILYKDKGVTFNSYDDYKNYLIELAKDSISNTLKKTIIITNVKVIK